MDTSSCALPTIQGETPLKHWSVVRNLSPDSDCWLPSDPPSEPWAEEKICEYYAVLWLSKMGLQRFIFFFSPHSVLFLSSFPYHRPHSSTRWPEAQQGEETMWKCFSNELNSPKKKLAIQPNWINKWTNPNHPKIMSNELLRYWVKDTIKNRQNLLKEVDADTTMTGIGLFVIQYTTQST